MMGRGACKYTGLAHLPTDTLATSQLREHARSFLPQGLCTHWPLCLELFL